MNECKPLARGLDVRLNWQVEVVDHSGGEGGGAGVTVRGAGGDTVGRCRLTLSSPR